MLKIIVDTNVLVSALIQRSYPYLIIDRILAGEHCRICLSPALLAEYFDVLNRKKFSQFPEFLQNAQRLLIALERLSLMYNPKINIDLLKDKDDNKILELADISRADFIITGNIKDFTIDRYQESRIVTPRNFWEMHFIP